LVILLWQRLSIGSRVTREGHARFWERPGVKVLRATRHEFACRNAHQDGRTSSDSRQNRRSAANWRSGPMLSKKGSRGWRGLRPRRKDSPIAACGATTILLRGQSGTRFYPRTTPSVQRSTFSTWGNSGIEPYQGTGNQLSRKHQADDRPLGMESNDGMLCRA
jgi:hypothetical protein